ncbi:proteasome component region PCI domain-containing protein [Heterostelium album PN500]|uniref:COP9 signalosome complex subunit 3 n=1 Tax=Heterostelium pallidum (strain ATCC 26659 / Pp 5 / PN500) TaxID=670386 RepID=D3B247_HETP5|nr:proteasome component region PCI domain-containing protein [Heterostelium album PN500]EFA84422.1 proteasome component region PCI domain-containing protein [Heterostelium album PN500]|eukprot:XP_020436536.1 proteasome component region PCI domain-containing protein [Heterostelium album PN500]
MDQFVIESTKKDVAPKAMKNGLTRFEEILEHNHGVLDNILHTLDPKLHSLGYLFVLKAKISDSRKNQQSYITQVINFIQVATSEQIKAAPVHCKHLGDLLHQLRQPARGVLPLKHAICALTDRPSQLTPIHSDFLILCILSKSYHVAMPVITNSITDVNPEQTSIAIKDVLAYFYYAGIVFATMKKHKQALESFKQVWTAPAHALSAIAIESYKKYYLVFLSVHGTTPGFPKYTPFVVQRTIKNHCKTYIDFGTCYLSGNMAEINTKFHQNAETFQKDNNIGLVKLSIRSIHRRNIKKLTQTFMTLSIRDIADNVKLSPADAEAIVLKMIEDGEIFATISQKDGMVTFHENPQSFSGHSILNELEQQINGVVSLETKLRAIDEQFSVSTPYLKRLLNAEKKMSSQYDSYF